MAETGAITATQAVPPPRKLRHRCHGVFAPNHKLRSAASVREKRGMSASGGMPQLIGMRLADVFQMRG